MKILLLVTSFILSCNPLLSQKTNQEILMDDGRQFLIGKIDVDGLKSDSYKTWYNNNYEAYNVDMVTTEKLKNKLASYKILLFMGTWCGDSKREVPRFLKILNKANFSMDNFKMVALDRRKGLYKTSPTGEEWGLQVKRVPTFIFLKDGKEVGRIVESPIESLEKDMLTIINQNAYTPNYSDSMKSE